MSPLDRDILAERAMAVERHLARVAERLPPTAEALRPATDPSDAVILHLWQATQLVVDLATAACLHFNLGAPASYADAFRRLAEAGAIDGELAGPRLPGRERRSGRSARVARGAAESTGVGRWYNSTLRLKLKGFLWPDAR